MATDEQISQRIEQLVGEEHQLWDAEAKGEASENERQRLDELKVTLRSVLGLATPATCP